MMLELAIANAYSLLETDAARRRLVHLKWPCTSQVNIQAGGVENALTSLSGLGLQELPANQLETWFRRSYSGHQTDASPGVQVRYPKIALGISQLDEA